MMPRGPKAEKRPADAISAAIMVAKIATGKVEDHLTEDGKNRAAIELGRKGDHPPVLLPPKGLYL